MRTLLLVRNGVSHDARVLRAARVAEQTLGGGTLVVGVATASASAAVGETTAAVGETTIEGVRVMRLAARGQRAARRRTAEPGSAHAHGEAHPLAPDGSPATAPTGRPGRPLPWRARARRILSGAWFAWHALLVARRERPALVHANDWNTMWCGLAIKLTCGARLVYDSHELWAERNGRWERRWWLLASEALFVRVADEVITASPGYADALGRRYRSGRATVVRNIPDVPGPPDPATSRPHTPPLAIYVGGLMPGRGLEQTIDALALAPQIHMRAIGPGSPQYRASLLARAASLGVAERIELQPPVPPAQLPAALAEATMGLCLIQPVCRSYELTLPNKLFEYAAAGVPVLASDMPTMASLVRKHDLGEVVPAADAHAIAAALERLAQPQRRSTAAQHARTFARANDWASEAATLSAVYRRAAATRTPARPTTPAVATQPARTR